MIRKAIFGLVMIVVGIAALAAGAVLWLGLRHDHAVAGTSPVVMTAQDPVERGRYLAQLGDCRACHTAQGSADYAGGRAIPTPFGRFYSPNITPDNETGIGRWSAEDFWNALHEGRARDGKLLYPVFPYTNYTRMTRDDSDAIYAYLRSVPAVHQASRRHDLSFPYSWRVMLVGWRALFFRAAVFQPESGQSTEWNRGAYLVQGLAHCSACHEARNALGGVQTRNNPAGGLVLDWYAPVLSAAGEAGVQDWAAQDIVDLLASGKSARGSAMGPMAEVVYESLQHGSTADIRAMATYLKSLPLTARPEPETLPHVLASDWPKVKASGASIYTRHCAQCHGDNGEGRFPAAPALAGNRALTMDSAVNPIRIVLFGGYTPGTPGNPRPFGMPPFSAALSKQEIADVLSYVRQSWGNDARPLTAVEVERNSGGPLW
ncbi:MAG: cytochrome c [Hydrocarboniphaga sp.]|uniref:cytochrome c n=1 Tax=Hydrocarboniphaga sp. TaxID=2033016 RepID=UPI00263A2561|nr:cytochrome c [Hydrocarboniphaga sp.]MDB5967950.1 cytochrome c [Hydrocarboniphaga sp.]